MKTYLFLTNSLGGYTGGPSYVRNKKIWLEHNGWNVVAFDSTGGTNKSIDYVELLPYEKNRIKELYFHPSFFCTRIRKKVLHRVISELPQKREMVVIESNTMILAEWGELLSKALNAKHLIYLIGENEVINDDDTYEFLFYKYKHDELFSISPKAAQILFSKYFKLPDADKRYWNAMSYIAPMETPFKGLEEIPPADLTICHFGRLKNYVPYVIQELNIFAQKYKDKNINIVFFGTASVGTTLSSVLSANDNLHVYYFDSTFPIPKMLFRKVDVVIATAGCARISYLEGTKTISMNVVTNRPLGVLGYTTSQISFSKNISTRGEKRLCVILEDVLISNKYAGTPIMEIEKQDRGYDYQMSFVKDSYSFYEKILSLPQLVTIKDYMSFIFLRCGLVNILSRYRYYKVRR